MVKKVDIECRSMGKGAANDVRGRSGRETAEVPPYRATRICAKRQLPPQMFILCGPSVMLTEVVCICFVNSNCGTWI